MISIARDGFEIGEWPEQDMRHLLAQGFLKNTDLYWKQGMAEWKLLSDLNPPNPPVVIMSPPSEYKTSSPGQTKGMGRGLFIGLFCLIFLGSFLMGAAIPASAGLNPAIYVFTSLAMGIIIALRLIDIGYPKWGWYLVLSFVPLLGWLVFYFCLAKSSNSAGTPMKQLFPRS
jgi:hypothetical protein